MKPKRSDAVSWAIFTAHLAIVFIPVYLSVMSGCGLRLLLFAVWFGAGMNGLLNLMHECSHHHVFKNESASAFLGRWVLGPLALSDFDAYRKRHWDHHRRL